MRKYNLRDALAYNFAKLLPHNEPNLWKMNDADCISILSWCEDWEPQKVYETAYKESRIEELLSWDEWSADIQPLPTVVRTELQRAVLVHEKFGNLKNMIFLHFKLVKKIIFFEDFIDYLKILIFSMFEYNHI